MWSCVNVSFPAREKDPAIAQEERLRLMNERLDLDKIVKAYAQDMDGLTWEECEDLGLEGNVCTALMVTMPVGSAGVITREDSYILKNSGLAENNVNRLLSVDGKWALYERGKWLNNHVNTYWWRPDFSEDDRIRMIKELGEIADPGSLPALWDVFKEGSPEVAIATLTEMGRFRDIRSVELTVIALQNRYPAVRAAAVKALTEKVTAQWQSYENDNKILDRAAERETAKKTMQQLRVTLEDGTNIDPISAIITASNDRDPTVVKASAEALNQINGWLLEPRLATIAKHHYHPVIREIAIKRLAQFVDNPGVVEVLIDGLRDRNASVNKAAEKTLVSVMDASLAPALVDAMKDRNVRVRLFSARQIGNYITPRTAKALVIALSDEDMGVRSVAEDWVRTINSPKTLPTLLVAWKEASPHVRNVLQEAIRRIPSAAAVPELFGMIESKVDPELARAFLFNISDDRAFPVIAQYVEDTIIIAKETRTAPATKRSLAVRVAAIEALGRSQDHTYVDKLLGLFLSGQEPEVRTAAKTALDQMLTSADRGSLIKVIRAQPVSLVNIEFALEVLARFEDAPSLHHIFNRHAAPTLTTIVMSNRESTANRGRAARLLAQNGNARTVPTMIRNIVAEGDGFPGYLLEAFRVPQAVPVYIKLLDSSDPRISAMAIAELAEIKGPRVAPALVKRLKQCMDDKSRGILDTTVIEAEDESEKLSEQRVCIQIISSLGELGTTSAVPLLISILSHPETYWSEPVNYAPLDNFTQAALQALEALQDPRAVPILISLMQNEVLRDQPSNAETGCHMFLGTGAAHAISKIRSVNVVRTLISRVRALAGEEETPKVKCAIENLVLALSLFDPVIAEPEMNKLRRDPNDAVRTAMREALNKMNMGE